MKLLSLLALVFSATSMAQYPPLDPARQAERDAVYGPGYLTPGNLDRRGPRPPMPPPPPRRPPMPPPPPRPVPGYGEYGPQVTVRWQDNGSHTIDKLVTDEVTIRVGGQLLNEVLVRSLESRVEIQSAVAYTRSGQAINLQYLTGTLRNGQERRSLLDYSYSVRVERIVIRATSPNLIGSRGQLQVLLGIAQ